MSYKIGTSLQHGLSGKMQLGDYLNTRARTTIGKFRCDYVARTSHSHLQSYLFLVRFILNFYVSCGLADMKTVKYFNLVGDKEDIGNERFKWSRVSTFSYNRNVIVLTIVYASTIRTHLLVHDTAHPMSAGSVHPQSAADCLIRSAIDISHPRQQGRPPASSSVVSDSVRSDIIIVLCTGTVGGVEILRWFLT